MTSSAEGAHVRRISLARLLIEIQSPDYSGPWRIHVDVPQGSLLLPTAILSSSEQAQ